MPGKANPFTPAEDRTIIDFKENRKLGWAAIGDEYNKIHTVRSAGALQVRYCRSLARRQQHAAKTTTRNKARAKVTAAPSIPPVTVASTTSTPAATQPTHSYSTRAAKKRAAEAIEDDADEPATSSTDIPAPRKIARAVSRRRGTGGDTIMLDAHDAVPDTRTTSSTSTAIPPATLAPPQATAADPPSKKRKTSTAPTAQGPKRVHFALPGPCRASRTVPRASRTRPSSTFQHTSVLLPRAPAHPRTEPLTAGESTAAVALLELFYGREAVPAAAAFPAYGIDPVVAVVEESSERSTIMAAPTAEDAPGCARLGLVVGEWVRAEEGEAARVRPGRNAQFARRGEGRVTGRVTRAFPGN